MDTIPGVFEALGLSAEEERVYTTLIESPGSSLRELGELLHVPRPQLQRALAGLRDKGFVTHAMTRPRVFIPSPPEAAVENLALKRVEEIHQARLAATHLAERHRAASEWRHTGGLLEILAGHRAVGQRFRQLQHGAEEELIALDRPPYTSDPGPEDYAVRKQMLERGVRCRVIYSEEGLEIPGRLSGIHELMQAGQEARVMLDIPTRMIIVDRRVGLLPLNFETPRVDDYVLVHASFLLHALVALFEILWERAMPLAGTGEAAPTTDEGSREELLRLLASGLKDESVARIFGQSVRTVARRMQEVMEDLGAKTRFQAGFLAYPELEGAEGERAPRD